MSIAKLTQSALFDRLAGGLAARVTVLTPNRRLAQALAAAFDRRQRDAGLARWEAADILPLAAFVERCWNDAMYSAIGATLPRLATPDEELALWEDVVRRSDTGATLLAVPETAQLAREGWELLHAWRLGDAFASAPHDDDAAAFAQWSGRYLARSAKSNLTDRARLPQALAALLGQPAVRKPECLVAWGFDIVTPQQRALMDAFAAANVEIAGGTPERRAGGSALRTACADAHDELRSAARWARARLEANPAARIGIVVPALEAQRDALLREFARTLAPGAPPGVPLPLNVSLGEPLAAVPVIAHALELLELCGREVTFERASLVVRSPFIAGAEAERALRACADAALRRRAEPVITLDRLAALVDGAPRLARLLGELAALRKARLFGSHSPRTWAEAFDDALRCAGFPGERGADSAEFQAIGRWHELLAQFARLERVAPRSGFGDALARVKRMAGAVLFQPESPDVPIQVSGVLEAAGLAFDHLWVTGLSDETWPLHPRANPFVPLALQRAAGVPNASPADTLALARSLTHEWLVCAHEVVLSHPGMDGERPLAPSPLILHVNEGVPEVPHYARWRDTIHAAGAIERHIDAQAPALGAAPQLRGGSAVLRDQAACPFRAFAAHRLGATALDTPHTGLDAIERGTLVHRVLADVWKTLKTKHALDAIAPGALTALAGKAADAALGRLRAARPDAFGERFAAIERARLVRLSLAWLDHERMREDFSVLATEDRRALAIGPLTFNARLDRVDQSADGARLVIDYKTGKPGVGMLLGERPDEPQLPLYLVAAEPDAAAVAFAQVRAGAMGFTGLSAVGGLLPGVGTPEKSRSRAAAANWPAQVDAWQKTLTRLAGDFATGRAEVDPKNAATCSYCVLQPLCRIHERTAKVEE